MQYLCMQSGDHGAWLAMQQFERAWQFLECGLCSERGVQVHDDLSGEWSRERVCSKGERMIQWVSCSIKSRWCSSEVAACSRGCRNMPVFSLRFLLRLHHSERWMRQVSKDPDVQWDQARVTPNAFFNLYPRIHAILVEKKWKYQNLKSWILFHILISWLIINDIYKRRKESERLRRCEKW